MVWKFHACVFQVQRPVHESLLDLDLTLDALACDHLSSSYLYAVKVPPAMAGRLTNAHPPAKMNGALSQHAVGSKTKLSEETVREDFSHFGTVGGVLLPEPGRRSRHVRVRE